jgi:hypothetical protein
MTRIGSAASFSMPCSKRLTSLRSLQLRCTQERPRTPIEIITKWMDGLELSTLANRKSRLADLLSSVDGIFALGNHYGMEKCPAERSHASGTVQNKENVSLLPKMLVKYRKNRAANPKASSRTSRHESKDSRMTSTSLSSTNNTSGNMLA